MAKTTGPTIRIGGKEYDVNRDFTWRELLTVEELSGTPLGRDDAFESMGVMGALVFVIQKREDQSLRWEGFLDGSISDLISDDEPDDEDEPVAKPRPTKPSA
jgi:hypothetical protein